MRTTLSVHDPDYHKRVGLETWAWLMDNGFHDAAVTKVEMIGEGLVRLTCLEKPTRVVDGVELATFAVDWKVRTPPPFMVGS